MKSKILSIYFPQFHAIPENDEWWGKGFTEWENVKKGRPFYFRHYQPREPLHDDYYDLSDLKVLERHVRLAQKAGIKGFCFYHYYFMGKKLLEKPIEEYRDNSKEQLPYCLIWANQSWMRTWHQVSKKNEILLQQKYGGKADWEKHFYYLLDFFKDERYIKIDNKPMYIIYIPQDIKSRRQMFMLWDQLAKKEGFDGIYLVAMSTSYGVDTKSEFYDSFMDFEPLNLFNNVKTWRKYLDCWKGKHINNIKKQCTLSNWIWTRNVYSYAYLCKRIEKMAKANSPQIYSGIFTGWDNTARKDEAGIVVTGSNPRKFQRHVAKMLRLSEKNKKEFLFLNAWNEWSEGAYIEPDKKYGYAYLNALRNAVYKYEQE